MKSQPYVTLFVKKMIQLLGTVKKCRNKLVSLFHLCVSYVSLIIGQIHRLFLDSVKFWPLYSYTVNSHIKTPSFYNFIRDKGFLVGL